MKRANGKLAAKAVAGIISNVAIRQVAEKQKKPATKKRLVGSSSGRPIASARAVAPIGQQIKKVLDQAKSEKKPLTYQQILDSGEVHIDGNPQLLKALQAHEYLIVDEILRTVKYRTKHNITNQQQMLELIRKHPFGTPTGDLKDAYTEAEADLAQLQVEQHVIIIQNRESTNPDPMVAYPNIVEIPREVDEEMRELLQSIDIPQEETLMNSALLAAGIKKSKRSTQRLKVAMITDDLRRGRKKKRAAIRNVTNAHMLHLFEGDEDASIDH